MHPRAQSKCKSKRFVLVKTFWEENEPKSKEDLDVVFRKVNVLQHLQKIFATASSRWLQMCLLYHFPILREWLSITNGSGAISTTLTKNTATKKAPHDILYVGLEECLTNEIRCFQKQIDSLEEAIKYAELRQAHPQRNVFHDGIYKWKA